MISSVFLIKFGSGCTCNLNVLYWCV